MLNFLNTGDFVVTLWRLIPYLIHAMVRDPTRCYGIKRVHPKVLADLEITEHMMDLSLSYFGRP